MIPTVIGSNPESVWLRDCLRTIPHYRTIHIHREGGYELSALRAGCTRFDRFLFLQDSTEILHPLFWNTIDTLETSAFLFGWPGMYLGVYDRTTLRPLLDQAPTHVDKDTSIGWEHRTRHHLAYPTLWPEVTDATGRIEHRHGRRNMVLENGMLRKWKGTWR